MDKQDWGWIGQPDDPRRRYVRRIRLRRGAGKGERILLTDLVDAEAYPAGDLSQVYLERRGIERMFPQVTEVFQLKSLIGSSPRATVFQASFCLPLYNVIQVMKACIAEGQEMSPKEISREMLFEDVHRQLTAWTEMLDDKAILVQAKHRGVGPGVTVLRARGLANGVRQGPRMTDSTRRKEIRGPGPAKPRDAPELHGEAS